MVRATAVRCGFPQDGAWQSSAGLKWDCQLPHGRNGARFQAYSTSRRRKASAPSTAAAAPSRTMMRLVPQSGFAPGASAMWVNSDEFRSQSAPLMNDPSRSTRNDHATMPYAAGAQPRLDPQNAHAREEHKN